MGPEHGKTGPGSESIRHVAVAMDRGRDARCALSPREAAMIDPAGGRGGVLPLPGTASSARALAREQVAQEEHRSPVNDGRICLISSYRPIEAAAPIGQQVDARLSPRYSPRYTPRSNGLRGRMKLE